MPKTVNILGDTAKEQWLNAIMIFEMCITSNVRYAKDDADPDTESYHCLEVAERNMKEFADEMHRLVEGVFDEK